QRYGRAGDPTDRVVAVTSRLAPGGAGGIGRGDGVAVAVDGDAEPPGRAADRAQVSVLSTPWTSFQVRPSDVEDSTAPALSTATHSFSDGHETARGVPLTSMPRLSVQASGAVGSLAVRTFPSSSSATQSRPLGQAMASIA